MSSPTVSYSYEADIETSSSQETACLDYSQETGVLPPIATPVTDKKSKKSKKMTEQEFRLLDLPTSDDDRDNHAAAAAELPKSSRQGPDRKRAFDLISSSHIKDTKANKKLLRSASVILPPLALSPAIICESETSDVENDISGGLDVFESAAKQHNSHLETVGDFGCFIFGVGQGPDYGGLCPCPRCSNVCREKCCSPQC